MDLKLRGKTVLVTGGSRGLGKAICIAFANEGSNVVFTYNSNAEASAKIVADIAAAYAVRCSCYRCDVSSEEDVKGLFQTVCADFGQIDVLVNNAGICPISLVKDMSLQEWTSVMQTNLTGVFLTSREMVNLLLQKGLPGRIVNIASQAAYNGSKRGKSHYSASKGGVVSFTKSLANEVAADKIFVNAVAPGMLYTEMTAGVLNAEIERYNQQIPVGRIADPAEIADFVLYMASEKCSYTTGTTIDISGGMIGI